jgi:3-oxoacyl-[acyl-carrier-protein] synthase III
MRTARVSAIASALPAGVLSNAALAAAFPGWSEDKIEVKTGIRERRIAGAGETAADLAAQAAERLFAEQGVDRARIDFLLFCSQTPGEAVPAAACRLQHRLGLGRHVGALDFSLGCSGFVYGLSLAKGLIEGGQAKAVLLLTAETYSRLLDPEDKGVRTLFGDAAAATLVEAVEADRPLIGAFVFGTDGAGAEDLSTRGGVLHMDGPGVMAFALRETPAAVARLLALEGLAVDRVDAFVFHQANAFMLEQLRRKLGIAPERFAVRMADCGNTVSSSIPIALAPELEHPGPRTIVLAGFGAGYSWAATRLTLNAPIEQERTP